MNAGTTYRILGVATHANGLRDLGHALSNVCAFCGHGLTAYGVAATAENTAEGMGLERLIIPACSDCAFRGVRKLEAILNAGPNPLD